MGAGFAKVLDLLGGGLFKEVRQLVDDVVTTKGEKLEIEGALRVKELEFKEKAERLGLEFEQEITARHAADSKSDSWLPKNIRPLTLVATVGMFFVLSMFSGFFEKFDLQPEFISTIKVWGMMCFSFYFSSRGIEKVASIIKGKNA